MKFSLKLLEKKIYKSLGKNKESLKYLEKNNKIILLFLIINSNHRIYICYSALRFLEWNN